MLRLGDISKYGHELTAIFLFLERTEVGEWQIISNSYTWNRLNFYNSANRTCRMY
jgi:hypothetical protein